MGLTILCNTFPHIKSECRYILQAIVSPTTEHGYGFE